VKVLFDTNVVLDLLLDREPFAEAAARLFFRVETGRLEGYLGATSVTTLHYLIGQAADQGKARDHVAQLLKLFQVAPVDRPVIEAALQSKLADFEDAVLHEAATRAGLQGIVTRNVKDFKAARLTIYTPDALLELLYAQDR